MLSPQGMSSTHFVVTELAGVTYLDTEPGRRRRPCSATWTACGSGPRCEVADAQPSSPCWTLAGPTARRTSSRACRPAGAPSRGRVALSPVPAGWRRPTARRGIDLLRSPAPGTSSATSRCADRRRRPTGRQLGRRCAAHPDPPAPVGRRHRRPHHPERGAVAGTAVHLDKGCYRGQETVARVHNLGRPPRRLVLLQPGRLGRLAAGNRRAGAPQPTAGSSAGSERSPSTTRTARSRSPWSSAPSSRDPLLAGGVDAADRPGDALVDATRERPARSAIDRRACPTSCRPGRG